MAGKGNEGAKPDDLVEKATAAGSDLSHGSQTAYDAMMQVVADAQVKYGANTPKMEQFNQKLATNLDKSGTLEEMAEQFASRNLDTVATGDGKHARYQDFNPQFGNDALEKAFLTSLRNNYGDLQARAGSRFLGGAKEEFGEQEFGKVLSSRQGERDQADQARLAQESQAREQRKLESVAGKLFTNDGNPSHSLYSMLDGIQRHGKNDGDISKGDLEEYRKRYAEEATKPHAEVNGWTKENFETVKTLLNEWDKPLGIALRGTHTDNNNSGHGNGRNEQVPNYYINMEAAGEALGLNGKHDGADIYAAYAPVDTRRDGAAISQVSGNGEDIRNEAPPPIPRNVPAADAATTASGDGAQFDANGNPVRGTAARTDAGNTRSDASTDAGNGSGSGAPIRRDLDASGRPVRDGSGGVVRDGSGNAVRTSDGQGDGYDQYYDRNSSGSAPTGAGRERVRATTGAGAGDNSAAGDNTSERTAAPRQRPGDVVTAAQRANRVADIDSAPPLTMPEFKAGDDMTKIAQDYQKAALDHFTASAIYTVKPGQGWDRVARDTMRKSGEGTDERAVLALSDSVAKLNGLSGRLDGSKVLHPGDQVQVRDAAWIKAQVDDAMAKFNKQVTDKTAAAAANTSDAPAGTDLYSGARNGEGDVTNGAASTTGDARTTTTTGTTGDARTTTTTGTTDAATQAGTTGAGTDGGTRQQTTTGDGSGQQTTTGAGDGQQRTTTTTTGDGSGQQTTTTGDGSAATTSSTGAIDANASTTTTAIEPDAAEQARRARLAQQQQQQQADSDGSSIYGVPPALG